MHTSPLSAVRKQLQVMALTLRGWLVRVGMIPLPDERDPNETDLTDEQQNARRTLRFYNQRHSHDW